MIGQTVAQYEILRKIDEGGMGEIYAARDTRLDRLVALKRIRSEVSSERMRRRLWREARAAAAVNHPNVCQIYDVIEAGDELLVAMELLEGPTLSQRLGDGPMTPGECVRTILQILDALDAVHTQGLVHRDLKPGNVVLARHGAKIVDFGLSRTPPTGETDDALAVTKDGMAVGTPRYMAPEQWRGDRIGPGCDVFAAGALFYEMLTGRPAIPGGSLREIMKEAELGEPPTVGGIPGLAHLDPVVRRSLERDPRQRYPNARAMADELRALVPGSDGDVPPAASATAPRERTDGSTRSGSGGAAPEHAARARRPPPKGAPGHVSTPGYTRLMVLPFRLLRPDPEIDFLSTSLPDAIVASLSGLDSVVLCSSAGLGALDPGALDVGAVSARVPVDAVLFGNLVRAGDRVRVATQLVDAPGGTVLAARTTEGTRKDIFDLQDRLAREIVDTLEIELTPRDRRALGANRPGSGEAYELYLRANQLANNRRLLPQARDLYEASIARDPEYAPTWARLGRAYRVMAKYSQEGDSTENFRRALDAFSKAMQIDPDLSVAHDLYTYLEVEELGRARDAMGRLLERAHTRRTDPHVLSGLVLTCRFCGLLHESLEAHRRARRLDPGIPTSVHYTFQLLGDQEAAIEHDDEDMRYVRHQGLALLGRTEEAIAGVRRIESSGLPGLERFVLTSVRASLEGNRDECVQATHTLLDSSFHDPEGRFFLALNVSRVGEEELALTILEACVDAGFTPTSTLENETALAPLRRHGSFDRIVAKSRAATERAREVFRRSGGPAILPG